MPRSRATVLATAIALALCPVATARSQSQATADREAIKLFLRTAKVIKARDIGRGVTRPLRLTLTDGTLTHDASFTSIDERKTVATFDRGGGEVNFVDSYHYNVAAYELAVLLGLGEMVPVTVEREWNGRRGSLAWWVETQFDEGERLKRKLRAPDVEDWNRQMYRVRVFSQLVYDTDRNLGNMLVTPDWKVVMIDFTRAFRLWREIKAPGDLVRCDRRLLERLRTLTHAEVAAATAPHLSRPEIDALIARRDLIVRHFETLVAQRGEAAVLYED
jgi:hypothetical protein